MDQPLTDSPEHLEKIRAHLLPGETLEAVWDLRKDTRVGSIGFLAVTSVRVVVYDRYFEEAKTPTFLSIPYPQLTAVAAQDTERQKNDHSGFSQLVLMTAAGSQRFILNGADKAERAERLILGHMLSNEGLVASWATVFRAGDLVLERVAPGHRSTPQAELMHQAREAAASGQDPSRALADALAGAGLLESR